MEYAYESLFSILVGELLGEGAHRKVYAYKDRKDLVIKIEREKDRALQNVTKYLLYRDAKLACNGADTWLAPVYHISSDGLVLIQKRTAPHTFVGTDVEIPLWMGNTTSANFGMIGERFVCHDYGDHQANQYGLSLEKLKTVFLT